MKGRTPNKAEQDYFDKVRDSGCIICDIFHNTYTPGVPHHLDGKTKPGAHYKTICLCWNHHQSNDSNPAYESVHGNKTRFEKRYMTQDELLVTTNRVIDG